MLQRKGVEMVGERWRDMFKLLVFDANMDIRDTLKCVEHKCDSAFKCAIGA